MLFGNLDFEADLAFWFSGWLMSWLAAAIIAAPVGLTWLLRRPLFEKNRDFLTAYAMGALVPLGIGAVCMLIGEWHNLAYIPASFRN